jgi:hypothetical protein
MNPSVKRLTSAPAVGRYHFWKSQKALTYGYLFVHGADPVDLELFYGVTLPGLIGGVEYPIIDEEGTYVYKYPNANGFPDIDYPETIAKILEDPTHRWALLCLLMKGHLGTTRFFTGDDAPERSLNRENFTSSLLAEGKMTTSKGRDFLTGRVDTWFDKNYGSRNAWGDLNANLQARSGLTAQRAIFRAYEDYWIPTFQSCCMDSTEVLQRADDDALLNCTGSAIAASIASMHEAIAVLAQKVPNWREAFEAVGADPYDFNPSEHPREDQGHWAFFYNLDLDTINKILHNLSNMLVKRKSVSVPFIDRGFSYKIKLPEIPIPWKKGATFSPTLIGASVVALSLAVYLVWRGSK